MRDALLLIEERPGSMELTARVLRLNGFHVTTAPARDRALSVADEQRPRLALVEAGTLSSRGFGLARTLCWIHAIPIVLVTPLCERDIEEATASIPLLAAVLPPNMSERLLMEVVKDALQWPAEAAYSGGPEPAA